VSSTAVVPVGPEAAVQVLAVIKEAFGDRPRLDPPADADGETVATLTARLAQGGGLLAELDGRHVGALVFDRADGTLHLRRFGVVPDVQGRGVAELLLDAALERAAGEVGTVAVAAREELPETIRFWEHHGFREVRRTTPVVELQRPVHGGTFDIPDADAMRRLGRSVARWLTAGDLVLLTGELGAGKTTFVQGLGDGLGVRGPVTSPTFVLARVHRDGRVPLVHVDAYRLSGMADVDDLDLDATTEEAVTVVEWGHGLVEQLADEHLVVELDRRDDDVRTARLVPVGAGWEGRLTADAS
jgi:tRNA threonylcarbamoyladenosine biosynthesis protein TsaE